VAARTVVGFGELILVLGVCLFGAAGTLGFWQAWVYLGVFSACVVGITAWLWRADPALLQRRLSAGPLAEPQRSQQVIQLLAGVAFVVLFVVCGLDRRFAWSTLPAALSLAADGGVVLGFLVVFLTFRENSYTAASIQVSAEQQVVSSGPYAIVRHPMYAGALLMLLASPIALGSWWGLLGFVALLGAICWRLLDEERFLLSNLAGYAAYTRAVRYRLAPRIW
jgi:protein-S-isoprenylcysteine O-methyltransferase Ste14